MAAHRPGSKNVIEISDDDPTESEADEPASPTTSNLLKRKAEDAVLVKDEWSDGSDGTYERFNNRKRKSTGSANKSDAKGKGKAKAKEANVKRRRKSTMADLVNNIKGVDESELLDDDEPDINIPPFLA